MSEPTTMVFDQTGIDVMIAMPIYTRAVPEETVSSLLATQDALIRHGIANTFDLHSGCSLPHHARSKAAFRFMASDCTHLFWIDSDITWEAKDFIRLLMLATKLDCVSGFYPWKQDPPLLMLGLDNGTEVESNLGCFRINGTGMGFTVHGRKIIEALVPDAELCMFSGEPEPIPYIFRCDISTSKKGTRHARGEDMAFFADIRAKGFETWGDPNVKIGHIGPKTFIADPREAFELVPDDS